jgi:hypothetical protein
VKAVRYASSRDEWARCIRSMAQSERDMALEALGRVMKALPVKSPHLRYLFAVDTAIRDLADKVFILATKSGRNDRR